MNVTETKEQIKGKAVTVQSFDNGYIVRIVRNAAGQRAAKISHVANLVRFGKPVKPTYVPLELCGLAAGKDAWMREIKFKCSQCDNRVKAGDMECEMCPACYDKAGEENAIADGSEVAK